MKGSYLDLKLPQQHESLYPIGLKSGHWVPIHRFFKNVFLLIQKQLYSNSQNLSGTPGLSGAVTTPQPTQPPQLPQPPCTPPRKHKAGQAQERCSSSAHRTHTRTKDIGTETETVSQ